MRTFMHPNRLMLLRNIQKPAILNLLRNTRKTRPIAPVRMEAKTDKNQQDKHRIFWI